MSITLNKVLISDNVDDVCSSLLTRHGIQVVCKYKLSEEDLIKELATCNGLIVRSDTKVTKNVIDNCKSLKVIGRAGTGVDNIDIPAATRKGIIVLNAPGGNTTSACELTCSLITCIARNVPAACQTMKNGLWDRKKYSGGSELLGKTLAVIGLGRIGRDVAKIMSSFGMKIIGYDPIVTKEDALKHSIEKLELNEIWPLADYITVHTPLIPQTKGLINDDVFSKCKKGVKIVNVARGGIINEHDLLKALKDGRCGGAALDVYSEEPPKSETLIELIKHENVISTPHLGASTVEAQTRVAVEVAEQFISLKNRNSNFTLTGIVNAPALLASRNEGNSVWILLAERLGRIIAYLAKGNTINNATVKITLSGPIVKNMTFLGTSVLVGLLSGGTKNGFNLINSQLFAKEANLQITCETSENTNNSVSLLVGKNGIEYSVSGTVVNDRPVLNKLNGGTFTSGSIQLTDDLLIFNCSDKKDIHHTIGSIMEKDINITNIGIAYTDKDIWIVAQTTQS